MIGIWNISIRQLRSRLALVVALLVTLVIAQGCTLPSADQWTDFAHRAEQMAASRPRARVNISFDTFCVGETGTVTWDGGAQFDDCDSSTPDPFQYTCGGIFELPCEVLSDTVDCKQANLYFSRGIVPSVGFSNGSEAYHLNSSETFVADYVYPLTASYSVQWDGWADRRAFRREVPDVSDRFTRPTGIVTNQDSATPIAADSYQGAYRDVLVCDEATRTWRFGRAEGSSNWGGSDGSHIRSVDLSPCVAVTQVCIPEPLLNALGRVQISVEGGPSIVLGGEGGPRCTDAFRGYHPEDIRIEPLDRRQFGFGTPEYGSSCTPGEVSPWLGISMVAYDIAPSSLCASGPTTPFPGSWSLGGIESLEFGTVELLGVSRDRCLAALDPLFLADMGVAGPMVPMSLTPDPTTCDLSQSCGDGVCNLLCENPNSCPADCAFSTQGGACYEFCDPDDPHSCLAGLSCLPRVVGGDEHICYNDAICHPDVTQEPNVTEGPGEQACACGDGVCEQDRCGELQQNCPADCGVSQPPPSKPEAVCGDGACNGGETCWSCSADCGPC